MFDELIDSTPVKSLASAQSKPELLAADWSTESHGEQLKTLKNSLKKLSPVDESRVLYFKSAIKLGTYHINSNKIALTMSGFKDKK